MGPIVPALPYIVPAVIAAGSMVFQHNQGIQQAARAREAQKKSEALYRETSQPQPEAIGAQDTQNRGKLGQARAGAYQNLSKQLAARGFGSGSGLGIKGATDIESNYIKGIGESNTELTKFANTRQFAPGADTYGYSVPGGKENMFGNMGNTMMGMYAMNRMLTPGSPGGLPGAAPTTPGVAPYNPLSQPAYSGYEAPYPSWMMQ